MRRRDFIRLLGGAVLEPLGMSSVHADPPGGCGAPAARNDGWPVASIDDAKLIDREALCRMADRLASMANVHAILVSRGGKLVFENYEVNLTTPSPQVCAFNCGAAQITSFQVR